MMPSPPWVRIALSPRAQSLYDVMEPSQQKRFWHIVAVIRQAPEDGAFFMRNADGSMVRQMTGANLHVISTVRMWPIGRVLLIALIEINDWQPWSVN